MQPLLKGDTWKIARTVSKVGDRSYLVQTDEGKTYRRNRKFIRTVPETVGQPDDDTQSQSMAGVPISEPVSEVRAGAKTRDMTSTNSTEADLSEPTMDTTPQMTSQELSGDVPIKRTTSGRVIKEPGKSEIT